jgi:hypothetical protein
METQKATAQASANKKEAAEVGSSDGQNESRLPDPSTSSDGVQISFVTNATDTVTRTVSAGKIIEAILTGGKGGKIRSTVEQVRFTLRRELNEHGDTKRAKLAASEVKKQLPAVLWSGTFTERKNNALVRHSGLLCADLDGLNSSLHDVRDKLKASPHVWALIISPSGDGLKAVFRVPADATEHAGSFRAVEQHVRELAGVDIDQACKDVARLCFMSYDPDIYRNDGATEIEPLPEPEKPKRISSNGELLPDMPLRERIASELLGALTWSSEKGGYFCQCPGKECHTSANKDKDTLLFLDSAATIKCQHNSCSRVVESFNFQLRSRIGKAEFTPTVSNYQGGQQNDSTERTDASSNGATDDELLRQLAALSPLEYDRRRKTEAEKLGCQVVTLDKLVEAKRPAKADNSTLQGAAVICPDTEPWPERVDGTAALNDVAETFTRYVALPDGAADALALWCTHTHCFTYFTQTPRLHVTSPERGCGKSTLRDVVALFTRRPLPLENMTTATAFRLVEKFTPTILADEVDNWLIKDNPELVGFLNSGHRRSGFYTRCEGENNEPRTYRAYAPAALCGIGNLPGTLHDRSIVVKLARAKPGEVQARFDSRYTTRETELCRKLARFCADSKARLGASDPKLPDGVFNRLADNWRPLFAIAEIAGGDWPGRCAAALAKLTHHDNTDVETLKVMLLADIREVITEKVLEPDDWIASGDLIDDLTANPERPWSEANRGKPINERWLSVKLGAFGIKPSKLPREGGKQQRGYSVATFHDAFDRYLSSPPVTSGQVSHDPFLRGKKAETDSETDVKIASVSAFYEEKTASETDVHLKRGGGKPTATTGEVVEPPKPQNEGAPAGFFDEDGWHWLKYPDGSKELLGHRETVSNEVATLAV